MAADAWLPVGFDLPDGTRLRKPEQAAPNWQIFGALGGRRALLVKQDLAERWIDSGILEEGELGELAFGKQDLFYLTSGKDHRLTAVAVDKSPETLAEALSFAHSLRGTRSREQRASLHDAIYVEKVSRLLPTFSLSTSLNDDVLLGRWLTGGVPVSVLSFRRLSSLMSWLAPSQLREIVETAGLAISAHEAFSVEREAVGPSSESTQEDFRLVGRSDLERFLIDHVLDIVEHQDRYRPLGVGFPSGIVLHGPPGSGKSFAVAKLVEYLGWPSFEINSSSIASPYIHETARKISNIFVRAVEEAPAVVVMDEMEAFVSDRGGRTGAGQHHIEEVAEFLRLIQGAAEQRVLVIGVTNRIEMVDPAILRRGRFDHVVRVGMPTDEEIRAVMEHMLASIPCAEELDLEQIAGELQGRQLATVAFVIRESGRLAAQAGKGLIDQQSLLLAVGYAKSIEESEIDSREIGFG